MVVAEDELVGKVGEADGDDAEPNEFDNDGTASLADRSSDVTSSRGEGVPERGEEASKEGTGSCSQPKETSTSAGIQEGGQDGVRGPAGAGRATAAISR